MTMHVQNYTATCVIRNIKTHQLKLRQSFREYRAIKAGDLVAFLCMTRPRQMQRRNNINHATSAQHAPRTSHTYTKKQNQQCCKLTNKSFVNPAGNFAPSRLVIWLNLCA
jgi:hypothetical protein